MQLEPVRRLPYDFDASAEALTIGTVDLVEYRFGAAVGSWTREAITAADRLRLVILAPTPAATGFWHDRQVSLTNGAAVLLGQTAGRWQTKAGSAWNPGQRATPDGPGHRRPVGRVQ